MRKLYLLLITFLLTNFTFSQEISFSDVAQFMGISFPLQNYYGSVSFTDFNDDGFDDLSFGSRGGYPLYIFRNDNSLFTNVTNDLGLTITEWGMQILWCDYDNDGDKDLFVGFDAETTYSRLFRNDGNGLIDVTIEAGLSTALTTTHSACWGDYNNDGWVDLYVTNYSEYMHNYLYKNNGDGTFTDVTDEAGVADTTNTPGYFKLPFVAVFLDYNNDGWQDIYIANDHFTGNTLFKNNGDGTFSDVSEQSGAGVGGFMMGLGIGDYNNDGFLDIYSSNDPFGNALLKNNGDGTFTDVAEDLGVTVNKSCWGTNFLDFDNDGHLDLFVCVEAGIPNNRNYFFKNNGNGTFSELNGIGFNHTNVSYGMAIGDYDNNGFYDIIVNNSNSSPNLYKNSGGSSNWIKLKLTGIQSNRDAVGSRIEAYFDGKKIIRELTCGISYSSQNSNSIILGVGDSNVIDSLKVIWHASGITDVLRNINVNNTISLSEGETITGIEAAAEIKDYYLFQNYPNPFNPTTKISFSIPVSSYVTLKIFDLFGSEIATLVDGQMAAGNYTREWNARNVTSGVSAESGYASGVYFYRLEAGTFSDTKKFILMK